jgi:beta-mannosidase
MLLQTLDSGWQVRPLAHFSGGIYQRDDHGWLPARVPGHWQQVPGLTHHHGKAVYRCRFHAAPAAAGRRRWLRINGAFYYRRVYLNGIELGVAEGYFVPGEYEVSALLNEHAANELIIELDSPDEPNKTGKRTITGVFSHWDCFDPQANAGGIWLPVELHESGPVRLTATTLLTLAADAHTADLRWLVDSDAAAPTAVTFRWTFTPRTFDGSIQVLSRHSELVGGRQESAGTFSLAEPQLWWPHDRGRPDLYTVYLELLVDGAVSDQHEYSFGIRTFTFEHFQARINGERIYIKGSNYPPGEMRIADYTPQLAQRDMQLAVASHMNMLRVHAHVGHPALYEAAAEAGILLWQDFPLQWLYQRSVEPEARRQAATMVRLLGHHPAIVLWCMHNEAVYLEDTADETVWTRLRTYASAFLFNWNRDVLDSGLQAIVREADPTRPVIRSSGEMGLPLLREGTDTHAYFGWYRNYGSLRTGERMIRRVPSALKFVTEFGAQSFPNRENSLKFMPDPLDDAAIARLAARHGLQAEIMAGWHAWRAAPTLAEAIELSQQYQIEINRWYIDRLRAAKYRPNGGFLGFMFVDPFPAVLWSIIDYWRTPKASYYAMRDQLRPVYLFALPRAGIRRVGTAVDLPIYAVNDLPQPVSGLAVQIRLLQPDGSAAAISRHVVDLPADCPARQLETLRLTPQTVGEYRLELTLGDGDDRLQQVYRLPVAAALPGKRRK